MPMPKFIKEPGYDHLTPDEKSRICNGAGAANDWRSVFISNHFYGLNCTEVFNIHDHAYEVGRTLTDKHRADLALLANLLALIDSRPKRWWFFVRHLRRLKAIDYYTAVVEFGDDAFKAGK